MKLYETTKHEEVLYEGRIIRVHVDDIELENGMPAKREVVDHPGGVSVAILTGENELIFVRQFRYPYKKVLLELPAGKLEPGEDPFEAVKREQREETGTTAESYISLGRCTPPPATAGRSSACGPAGPPPRGPPCSWTRTSFWPRSASPLTKRCKWC